MTKSEASIGTSKIRVNVMTINFKRLREFGASETGSTAIMFGLLFSTVMGAVSFAIDFERAQTERKVVQDHLDSTLLHLGRGEDKLDPQVPGTKYLLDSLGNTDISTTNLTPEFVYDPVQGTVTGTVNIKPKSILSGGIIPPLQVTVKSVAKPRVEGKVEIALVLDNSGSMNYHINNDVAAYVSSPNRRADSLQSAVSGMLDVIYSNPKVTPAVSVIPYASSVDITDLYVAGDQNRFEAVNDLSKAGLGIENLNPASVVYQDRTATKGVWAAERYMSKFSDGSYRISLGKPTDGQREVPVISQGIIQTQCHWTYYYYFGSTCIKYTVDAYGNAYLGSPLQPLSGLMPMTFQRQNVRDYISSLEPEGGTAGHLGLAWGLYSLTPAWNDVFKHDAGEPQKFNQTTEKYLVMMTDGEFNTTHDRDLSGDDIFAYFESVCAAARKKGITIFTVGLKITESSKTDLAMKNCAGDSGRYFPVDDHDSLGGAFIKIGRETGGLRISS